MAAGALAAFAVLTLLSVGWAASDEKAFLEFTRVLMYLGVLVLVAVAVTRRTAASVADGLALGIVAVVLLALASRLFFGDVGPGAPPSFFPVRSRLHYPVNYWNGLAILAGLAFPLLLRAAVAQRPAWLRALALVPVPAMASAIYLTSSRGGYVTAAVGVVVFCALTSRRLSAIVATADRGRRRGAGDHGHAGPRRARERPAGLCAGLQRGRERGAADGPARPFLRGRVLGLVPVRGLGAAPEAAPARPRRRSRWRRSRCSPWGWPRIDPVDKFETFKKPSGPDVGLVEGDFTRSHLISSTGSGRWQLWTSAVDEWETKPVFGRGAGSYQSWWMEHASLPLFVRDAHSLWLETLAELGLVGLLLLVIAFGTGFVAAIAPHGPPRPGPAAGGGDGRRAGGVRAWRPASTGCGS